MFLRLTHLRVLFLQNTMRNVSPRPNNYVTLILNTYIFTKLIIWITYFEY